MKSGCKSIVLTLLLSVFFWFICSPVSKNSTTDDEPALLLLSLEEDGRTNAEFSGAPIPAIIELDVDTFFNVLDWHTGQGHPVFSDSLVNKKAQRFSLLLTWNKYPLLKDSSTGLFFDTVYVSIGGSLKKSNRVFIKVTNLPVIIDSASFNGAFIAGGDTVWRYTFTDTILIKKRYPLRIYARDLDSKPLSLQVLGPKKGNIIRTSLNSMEMEYESPPGDFKDTISFVVYDQKGGQIIRQLILNRSTPNIIPVIDSIQIGSTMLKGSGIYMIGFSTLGSLKLRLFAHDSLGTIRQVTWKSKNYSINADSLNKMAATWACTTKLCRDTTVDTLFIIDTITVKAFDDRNDSTTKYIAVHKGTINQQPVIKTMRFNDKNVQFSDSLGVVTAAGGTSYSIKMAVVDPENDSLEIIWNSIPVSRISGNTDSSVTYSAPALRDTDVVHVSISDGKSTVYRSIKIIINDIGPVLDSILIADSLYRNPDATIMYTIHARDTLLLIAYSNDRDEEDSLSYQWTAGKVERFTTRLLNRAKYILPASNLRDTIILTLQDGTVQIDRKIILLQIDSIKTQ